MPGSNKSSSTTYQYAFPQIPRKWGHDEILFAQGLRRLFDLLFAKKDTAAKTLIPVGVVIFSATEAVPYSWGTWEEIESDLTGIHAWKRTA